MTLDIIPREFVLTLTEKEASDLVIAISSHHVSPNHAHNIRMVLIKALGYTPTDPE